MPSYLSLGNWTEQGIRSVNESPQRLAAVKKAAEDAGGRLIFFYMTMGQYDFAALLEMPDDESAARMLLKAGKQGNIRTTTLRAFTEDEYVALTGSV